MSLLARTAIIFAAGIIVEIFAESCRKFLYEFNSTIYYQKLTCTYGCCNDLAQEPCCVNNSGVIAGSVVGGLAGLIIICIIVGCICYTTGKKNAEVHPLTQGPTVGIVAGNLIK